MTPHAEKLIMDAPTVEAAKDRAATVRAMAPAGARREPARQPQEGEVPGLTGEQRRTYRAKAVTNQALADVFAAECTRENAKKGGAK
jgi:hypothetical protein